MTWQFSEEIQFARINYYRSLNFAKKNQLGLTFGSALSKFFRRDLEAEIFELVKLLRIKFTNLEVKYNSPNTRGRVKYSLKY